MCVVYPGHGHFKPQWVICRYSLKEITLGLRLSATPLQRQPSNVYISRHVPKSTSVSPLNISSREPSIQMIFLFHFFRFFKRHVSIWPGESF